MLNEQLLNLLRCPMNPSQARLRPEGNAAVCEQCGLRFKIRDGILNMVVEEAELPPGCEALSDLPCQRARTTEQRSK
jgi:uncharacterized protein YbaR (Trm112 family)